jgi:hypothetical protein
VGSSPVPDALEVGASSIVTAILGGTSTWTDSQGAPPKTPDYSIQLPDNTLIALEVTSTNDSVVRALFSAVSKQDWESTTLSMSWAVSLPHAPVQMKALRQQVEPHLLLLEGDALDEYGPATDATMLVRTSEGAVRALRALGITAATAVAVPSGARAVIAVGFVGPAGHGNPDDVNRIVEAESVANSEKLLGAGASEGHLFVWVDPSHPEPAIPMFFGTTPSTPPTLAPGVDVAWIATQPRGTSRDSHWAAELWRVAPPKPWEILKAPSK